MKKFLIYFLIIPGLSGLFISCGDVTEDRDAVINVGLDHNRGNPLDYIFNVEYSFKNHSNGEIVLRIEPGPNSSSHQDWWMGNLNGQSSGDFSKSYTFPDNNPSPTSYTIYPQLRSLSSPYPVLETGTPISIDISFQKFNIIQLAMINDNLWPNYPEINYYGFKKRDEAFGDANTLIKITENITDIQTEIFYIQENLFIWTVTEAGGNINAPGYGLDQNVAIVCGIENYTNPPEGNYGLTFKRGLRGTETVPARTYTFMKRINELPYDNEKKVVLKNGITIHEMGHARGIDGDEYEINPPHSGSDLSYCVMWWGTFPPTQNPPEQRANFYVPYFCMGHRDFIKGITW